MGNNFVVFGSAPLYLYGVVEFTGRINDLDVFVEDLAIIPSDAEVVTFHKNLDQKLYKITVNDLEVDIGSHWPGYEDFLSGMKTDFVIVEGFKFASLDIVEGWKTEMVKRYDRQKDKDYLAKIKAFREN